MNKKKRISVLLLMSPFLMMAQAKDIINAFLDDWLLPIFVLFVIIGAVHGIVANASLIMDKNEEGTVWKGFANVGKVVLFYTLAFAIIAAIVAGANAAISNMKVS